MKHDGMTLHAERPEHRPERKALVQQHRPLLDVQFKVGRRILQLLPAILDLLEVDPDLPQGIR